MTLQQPKFRDSMKSRKKKASASAEQWDRLLSVSSSRLEENQMAATSPPGLLTSRPPSSSIRERPMRPDDDHLGIAQILASIASDVNHAQQPAAVSAPVQTNGKYPIAAAASPQHRPTGQSAGAHAVLHSPRPSYWQGSLKHERRHEPGATATGTAVSSLTGNMSHITRQPSLNGLTDLPSPPLQNGYVLPPREPGCGCKEIPTILLQILDRYNTFPWHTSPLLEHLLQFKPYVTGLCSHHMQRYTSISVAFLLEEAARASQVIPTSLGVPSASTAGGYSGVPSPPADDQPPAKKQRVEVFSCPASYYDCAVDCTPESSCARLDHVWQLDDIQERPGGQGANSNGVSCRSSVPPLAPGHNEATTAVGVVPAPAHDQDPEQAQKMDQGQGQHQPPERAIISQPVQHMQGPAHLPRPGYDERTRHGQRPEFMQEHGFLPGPHNGRALNNFQMPTYIQHPDHNGGQSTVSRPGFSLRPHPPAHVERAEYHTSTQEPETAEAPLVIHKHDLVQQANHVKPFVNGQLLGHGEEHRQPEGHDRAQAPSHFPPPDHIQKFELIQSPALPQHLPHPQHIQHVENLGQVHTVPAQEHPMSRPNGFAPVPDQRPARVPGVDNGPVVNYSAMGLQGPMLDHVPKLDKARDNQFRLQVIQELQAKPTLAKGKSHGDVTGRLVLRLLQLCQSPDDSEAYVLSGHEAAARMEAGPTDCPIFTEGQQLFTWDPNKRPIEQMFRRMENLNRSVSVQVPSRKSHYRSFQKQKLSEVQQRFLGSEQADSDDPWNILDLSNPLPPTTMPKFLAGENCQLLLRVRDAVLGGSSGERTVAAKEKWNEWLNVMDWVLLSEGGHNTAPHTDSHGLSTWISVQEGFFGFGWLSKPTKEERDGWINNPQEFASGRWRFTVLTPGKTVFFPSGTIHFVFRLRHGQTLALGGHVLQWNGVERWINIVREQMGNPQITNEDVEWSAPKYVHVITDLVKNRVNNGRVAELGGQELVDSFLRHVQEFDKERKEAKAVATPPPKKKRKR